MSSSGRKKAAEDEEKDINKVVILLNRLPFTETLDDFCTVNLLPITNKIIEKQYFKNKQLLNTGRSFHCGTQLKITAPRYTNPQK